MLGHSAVELVRIVSGIGLVRTLVIELAVTNWQWPFVCKLSLFTYILNKKLNSTKSKIIVYTTLKMSVKTPRIGTR